MTSNSDDMLDTRQAEREESGEPPSEPPPPNGDDDAEGSDLTMLLWAHYEQWINWLQSFELKGKLVLLTLLKSLACSLLLVLFASSAWTLAVAALVVTLVKAGVPLAAALGLAALLMAFSAWILWRLIVQSIRFSVTGDMAPAPASIWRQQQSHNG